MQRQAKKRSEDAGGAGGTKRAVTPRSAFIVLACTAIAEYFAFYLRLADAGAKAGIPHGGYVMCALICGVASLATTAGFGLLLFAERNRITKNLKQLLITAILLLVSTVLSAFATCVGYAFTAAFLGIILAALLVGRHCAYACTAMMAVYAALFACLPDAALAYKPLSMLAAVSAGGFAAVIALKINKGRTSPIISGVIGGIVSGIILICVQAFFGVRITDVLLDACGLLASSALCGVLAVGLMPVCESIFDVTTETRLNDLLNNNNPLLKRLMFEAPGTYHHSILVAALAESAADEVDANSLLCKVAAYYHDVGKLTSPAHFIENQRDYNIHDELPPEESARRIISHQSDGVTLLKKHKFPSDVIEIVAQHHGDSLVRFFYSKAVNDAGSPEEVDAAVYRYKANKPSTKESAIIMLADCCEAAVRSMKNPTHEMIADKVHEVINGLWLREDGQLSESPLTAKDIKKIEQSFLKTLSAQYHERVEYPPLEEKTSEQQV